MLLTAKNFITVRPFTRLYLKNHTITISSPCPFPLIRATISHDVFVQLGDVSDFQATNGREAYPRAATVIGDSDPLT
jgi:hypothetical protein